MGSMFGLNADLSGLFSPSFEKSVHVTDVIHKAIIEIYEVSTEVDADTGAI